MNLANIGRSIEVLATIALAVAAAYSAFSASESARIAKDTAMTAQEAVLASKDTAEIAREWLETSARPLVAPINFRVRPSEGTPTRIEVAAQLRDIGDVPTAIHKVCVWQSAEIPASEDRRTYEVVRLREGLVVYRDLYSWIEYPDVLLQTPRQRTLYLSAMYSISRERSPITEVWRAETQLNLTVSPDGSPTGFDVWNTDVYPIGADELPC